MKKVLLFNLLFFFLSLTAYGYETILINYPDGEAWENVYYRKIGNESLIQHVPTGQTFENWDKTIIIHSYKDFVYPLNSFVQSNASKMLKTNPTGKYKTIKMKEKDAILTRCTDDYKNIKAQCEFFRTAKAHEGIITIHYINRNKQDFWNNYTLWLNTIKNIKFYNSFYRNDRVMNKSEYFELW